MPRYGARPPSLEEARLAAPAAHKRRRDFAGGRNCGAGTGPIRMAGLSLRWRARVASRYCHAASLAASPTAMANVSAAVARATDLSSIGIDAEMNVALPNGVEELVCRERERRQIARLPQGTGRR